MAILSTDVFMERINSLIDARVDLTSEQKVELKKKLEPIPFDVYGIAEEIEVGIDIKRYVYRL